MCHLVICKNYTVLITFILIQPSDSALRKSSSSYDMNFNKAVSQKEVVLMPDLLFIETLPRNNFILNDPSEKQATQ